jgi:ribonuclease-3
MTPPSLRPSLWQRIREFFAARPPVTEPARKPRVSAVGLAENESRVLEEFGQHFGVRFRDPALLKLALTHRSYLHVTGQGPRESNERLEFLGDSVLGLVTSENLYLKHPNEHEGQLTKTKSLLVSKAILSRRALAMGLGRFVFMSHSEVESGGRQRLSILADAFESVVGAIYLDQGFEASRSWLERWLLRDARTITSDRRHTNYKSHLQEYVQSTFRTHPVYRIRSAMGPDHSKMFMVDVMVGRKVLGEGRGKNKKEAEQAAARDALERAGSPVTREEDETRSARVLRRESRAMETLLPEPDETGPVPLDLDGDEDDDERRRRRRGRRGGRSRREHEAEGAGPVSTGARSREAVAPAAPPRPREAVVAPPPPRSREATPPQRPRRVRLDEDTEEVGRPDAREHDAPGMAPHTGWSEPAVTPEPEPWEPDEDERTIARAFDEPEAGPSPRPRPVMSFDDALEPEHDDEPVPPPPSRRRERAPDPPARDAEPGGSGPSLGGEPPVPPAATPVFGRRSRRGR